MGTNIREPRNGFLALRAMGGASGTVGVFQHGCSNPISPAPCLGEHFRAGDLELHPGIAGEVGFDSNFFQASGEVTPSGMAALIPPQFRPVLPDGIPDGNAAARNCYQINSYHRLMDRR